MDGANIANFLYRNTPSSDSVGRTARSAVNMNPLSPENIFGYAGFLNKFKNQMRQNILAGEAPSGDSQQQPQNTELRIPSTYSSGLDEFARESMAAESSARAPSPRAAAPMRPAAVPEGPKAQLDAINAQTMQAANGKDQEYESMSDLQKMVQAYFGGRTEEQRQNEAFKNIAASLAAGKSPRFLDNLGGAVGGALNFERDDTNRREKEALEFGIKNQNLVDNRFFNEGQLGLGSERNEIAREDSRLQRAQSAISAMNNSPAVAAAKLQYDAEKDNVAKLTKFLLEGKLSGAIDAKQEESIVREINQAKSNMDTFISKVGGTVLPKPAAQPASLPAGVELLGIN